MTTLYAVTHRASQPAVPLDLRVVILFCLLGLTISLAVFSQLDADAADFILNTLQ